MILDHNQPSFWVATALTPHEIAARQMYLICTPGRMGAEGPLVAPIGGSVRVLPVPSSSLR